MSPSSALTSFRGGLVVSCQAQPGEPLFTADGGVMPLLALAAERAGAVGIRAESVRDIAQIKDAVSLPVIGLVKKKYEGFEPFITVTMTEVDALVELGTDVIAIECTDRPRPDGLSIEAWVAAIRERHPAVVLMADIATFDEAMTAAAAGVDVVGTTLSGYTPASAGAPAPNFELVARLAQECPVPVIAEGRVRRPEQARRMLDEGAHCVVVGGAITRPLEIATEFVDALR